MRSSNGARLKLEGLRILGRSSSFVSGLNNIIGKDSTSVARNSSAVDSDDLKVGKKP